MADLIARIRGFLFSPVETFREARTDSFGESLVYLGAITLVSALLSAIRGSTCAHHGDLLQSTITS